MKLWILKRTSWKRSRNVCDEAIGFVIRAETEEKARRIASSSRACTMGCDDVWTSTKKSSCKEITQEGEPEIILMDVLEG